MRWGSTQVGKDTDPARLPEYEWRLEKMFRRRPELSGICQHHADTLPRALMRQSLLVHPSVFINQTLSLINPHFLHSGAQLNHPDHSATLDALTNICRPEPVSET